MNIDNLLTDKGLRSFTASRRDQHLKDARAYGQIGDIIRRRLEQTPLDGDHRLSARLRARRVYRQVRAMERASQRAATAAETLYATYRHQVLEVPERRQLAAARKEGDADRKAQRRRQRRAAASGYVARSLEQSTRRLTTASDRAQEAEDYLDAEPFLLPQASGEGRASSGPRSIGDFMPKSGSGSGR